MTWEPGKIYKTRGGQKARIYANDGGGVHSIHGALLINGQWISITWFSTGAPAEGGFEYERDLTLELWTEPKPRWLAWGILNMFEEDIMKRFHIDYFADSTPPTAPNWFRVPWADCPEDWQPEDGG